MAMEVVLSLGSNKGDRLRNLQIAHEELTKIPESRVLAKSLVYETDPVDVPTRYQAARFYNAVILMESELSAESFSELMHDVEARMGRERGGQRNSPRIIDIDLIAYGEASSDTPSLRLPHPEAFKRRFVLQPLCDVQPCFTLPGTTVTAAEALSALPERPLVTVAREQWKV